MNDLVLKLPNDFIKDIENAIKILKNAGSKEIFIFGSLAKGEYNKNSDIDLAVKGLPKKIFYKVGGILMFSLKHSFDLIELDDEQSDFSMHIKNKGELIRVA